MKKKYSEKKVVVGGLLLITALAIAIAILPNTPFSTISTGGSVTCERVWTSTNGSLYYLNCSINYSVPRNCDENIIIKYTDETPYFTSLSNWKPEDITETCSIIESQGTYVKIECSLPKDYKQYCGGESAYSVTRNTRFIADLDYQACYGLKYYREIGEMYCSSDTVKQCTAKDTTQTVDVCSGELETCQNAACIQVECKLDSHCPPDTCQTDYSCPAYGANKYTCVSTPKILPPSPCVGAIWQAEPSCSWDTSGCPTTPPPPEPPFWQAILEGIIDWLNGILEALGFG